MTEFEAGALFALSLVLLVSVLAISFDEGPHESVHYHWHWHAAPRQPPPQIEREPERRIVIIEQPPTTTIARRDSQTHTDIRQHAKIERVNL